MNHHMRYQLAVFAQLHAGSNDAIWPDGAGRRDLRFGIYDCRGMNHSVVSAEGSEPADPRLIDTSCALTIPSQTTLPSTNALPSMRTAMREAPCLQQIG